MDSTPIAFEESSKKNKKTKESLIFLAIIAAIAIAAAGFFYYKWFTAVKYDVPFGEIGSNFTAGNEVMDRLQFSEKDTPTARNLCLALFNSNRSDVTTIGSWDSNQNGDPIKTYSSENFVMGAMPILTKTGFEVDYSIEKTNYDIDGPVSDYVQVVYICNGKEISPTNFDSDDSIEEDISYKASFDNVQDGDDFVMIVYNTADQSAVAFPFVVGHYNIYG